MFIKLSVILITSQHSYTDLRYHMLYIIGNY